MIKRLGYATRKQDFHSLLPSNLLWTHSVENDMSKLTQARAQELFYYYPKTGSLRWRTKPAIRVHVGDLAGSDNGLGYLRVSINNRLYMVHRIIMLYMLGEWPKDQVDHIDRNKINNSC